MGDSALDIYKDIASGTAQINPFSDYFQESELNMNTLKPIFEGRGITRDVHVQAPFSCEGASENDIGCNSKFPEGQEELIQQMEAESIPGPYTDKYDYSRGVFFDYSVEDYKKIEPFMKMCDPLIEDPEKCLQRIFECEGEWSDCSKHINYCEDNKEGKICKYNINKELIQTYYIP
jgi:hypothetical protein